MKPALTALVIVAFFSTAVSAQTPAPPPMPIDATTIYSHLIFLESRVESLSTQLKDTAAADLASQHQIGLQVEAVHELLIVEAAKPNPIVGLLTNRTFWEMAAGLATSIVLLVKNK